MKLTNKSRARPRARHVISAGKPIISAPSANQPPNTPQVATVQPVTSKATPSVPSTEVAAITSFLFGMESEDRTGQDAEGGVGEQPHDAAQQGRGSDVCGSCNARLGTFLFLPHIMCKTV